MGRITGCENSENDIGKCSPAFSVNGSTIDCRCPASPPDCHSDSCMGFSGCNRGKRIGKCFSVISTYSGDTIDCKCPQEPIKDCWHGNKCMLDYHCGGWKKNGKCVHGWPQVGSCICNV